MHALDDYKRASGRMFPTCSEILEVVRKLGYSKPGQSLEPANPHPVTAEAEEEDSMESMAEGRGRLRSQYRIKLRSHELG